MNEDVRQQRAHEEERRRTRISDLNDTGFFRAPEIARHDFETTPRRTVFSARIERNDERRIRACVHTDHEMLDDRRARERHPLFRDAPKDDTRVRRGIDGLQVDDALRQRDVRVHRRFEQRLLGVEVPQDRRRGDPKLAGDVRQRRRREAFQGEDGPCAPEDLLAADSRRPAHL